jgi:Cof subfamily protein (haloacid dehalogenase superfamily)
MSEQRVGEYGVRCVATDLDGTLVRTDGTISARTAAAIAAVESAGLDVVLVTGRPPRWMHPVAEATGHRGLAVCANGALIYDLHTERVVETFPLGLEAAADVVDSLRRAIAGVSFAVERGESFGHEPGYQTRYPMPAGVVIAPMDELLAAGPAVKILVRHGSLTADELLASASEALGQTATVTHSNVNDRLLEISAAGVSKASTLARLCEQRGILAAQVVAFGDMPNDLPMLEWAGTSYAVANAHPDVLAAVDHVTASNDEDGVAVVLEELLAGN